MDSGRFRAIDLVTVPFFANFTTTILISSASASSASPLPYLYPSPSIYSTHHSYKSYSSPFLPRNRPHEHI